MNRSSPVYLDPQRGDAVRRDGKVYRVVARGVADSVQFERSAGASTLIGRKSLPCWRRLIEGGEILATAPR